MHTGLASENCLSLNIYCAEQKTFNSRKGQRTNQMYRNLVGCDQQMQWLA